MGQGRAGVGIRKGRALGNEGQRLGQGKAGVGMIRGRDKEGQGLG